LGVDPGSRCSGWAVVAGSANEPELIASGELKLPDRLPLADRLARLHAGIMGIIERYAPSEAAVESPFHGVSARSALQLAHARGAVLAAMGSAGLPVAEYSPATIKLAVTGNGRADKTQVTAMVYRLVAPANASGGSDAADAVAAALCHLFASGLAAALEKSGIARPRR
jgi:crossover junction endodeoxyribonuclease RuvC